MFLKYLHFFPDHSGYVENRLDKKGKVNFKIYDVINWETLLIYIFLNISRSTDNQTMKFRWRKSNFIQFVFIVWPSRGLRCWPFVFTSNKALSKNRDGLELASLPHWKKKEKSRYILYFHLIVWLTWLLGRLGNMCIVTVWFPVSDFINPEINLSFFIRSFSYITKKVKTKVWVP